MKKIWKNLLYIVVSVALLLAFFHYESINTVTPINEGVLKTLELITTLYIGWFLSRLSAESEFFENQKKFAISAFRRIKEIEKGIDRLILKTDSDTILETDSSDMKVVHEIVLGVKETVRSSVVDWADIIGDEIAKFQEIQNEKVGLDERESGEQGADQDLEKKIASLPPELRLSVKEMLDSERDINNGLTRLIDRSNNRRTMVFDAFWENSFERDILDLNVGDTLIMRVGDARNRVGSLLVYDQSGKSIGVVLNTLGSRSYDNFVNSMVRYFGMTQVVGRYVQAAEVVKSATKSMPERHYFKIELPVPLG